MICVFVRIKLPGVSVRHKLALSKVAVDFVLSEEPCLFNCHRPLATHFRHKLFFCGAGARGFDAFSKSLKLKRPDSLSVKRAKKSNVLPELYRCFNGKKSQYPLTRQFSLKGYINPFVRGVLSKKVDVIDIMNLFYILDLIYIDS